MTFFLLREAHENWMHFDEKKMLGKWKQNYIAEPISGELISLTWRREWSYIIIIDALSRTLVCGRSWWSSCAETSQSEGSLFFHPLCVCNSALLACRFPFTAHSGKRERQRKSCGLSVVLQASQSRVGPGRSQVCPCCNSPQLSTELPVFICAFPSVLSCTIPGNRCLFSAL